MGLVLKLYFSFHKSDTNNINVYVFVGFIFKLAPCTTVPLLLFWFPYLPPGPMESYRSLLYVHAPSWIYNYTCSHTKSLHTRSHKRDTCKSLHSSDWQWFYVPLVLPVGGALKDCMYSCSFTHKLTHRGDSIGPSSTGGKNITGMWQGCWRGSFLVL